MANIKSPVGIAKRAKSMSRVERIELIEKELGYLTFSRPPKFWLKTGSKRLNRVLGSEELGIPYGKEITLAGMQSSGKTLLCLRLAGLAQKDGAEIGWIDVENSFDPDWALKQGLDAGEPVYDDEGKLKGYTNISLFNTKFGSFKKKEKKVPVFGKKPPKERDPEKEEEKLRLSERQQSAEELLTLVEKWMLLQRKLDPDGKIFLGLDSTTALQPEEEIEAGYTDQNMRTRMSLAPLLNTLSKRMIPIALNTNALVVFICQLRTKPNATMFENPEYVPGGNGILFYPSCVTWMKRVRNVYDGGKNIGLESVIDNRKNKMGYGSVEREKVGVSMKFQSSDWQFVESDELFKKKKG